MKQVVSGVLLLDKPCGISSHAALAKAKFLLQSAHHNSKKAGHTGTLDPMATGLLPLCFGEATKFAQYGLTATKGYTAIIRLGQQTDTGDADGAVIAVQDVPDFDDEMLQEIAHSLLGTQQQVPPMYSALKKDGKKLYEYARAGVEIERESRAITIFELTLHKRSADELALSVVCSKGTYVRVLGETVAQQLGTVGHLTALRRTQTGSCDIANAITLDEFECLTFTERLDRMLPVDYLIQHFVKIELDDIETQRAMLGQRLNIKNRLPVAIAETTTTAQSVRLYHDGKFVGLGTVEPSGRLQPKKMLGTAVNRHSPKTLKQP
ncbi:MAG: tRNA pseudouridine(55) synthase TruB [Moraxella sp.]|nr:tRNA pseudouridine(55) synthase TruB [Moraxella sp.]